MPMPADFPQAIVSSTTLALTIFHVPEHAEPKLKQELVYEEPEDVKQELKREMFKRDLEYEDPKHAEPVPELERELDHCCMIRRDLEKDLSFAQKPNNYPQVVERSLKVL